jgi:hypothetical protein
MISRERVQRTLQFDSPDRVPFDLWTLPWAELHHPLELAAIRRDFPSDFISCPARYREPPSTEGDPYRKGFFIDEWGCRFTNIQDGAIGEVKQPMVQNWATDREVVRFPREWLTFDTEAVRDFHRSTDKFTHPPFCPRPFERLQFLRGSENLYMDLADPDQPFASFLSELHAFYCEGLERWAKTPVDCLRIMDDWGGQNSLLISPRTWRTVFGPLYREYIEIAHAHGKPMFMHSDGYIADILPDLVEYGLDAINSQVFCMGFEKLRPLKGKITFWGEIDRQELLPQGTQEDIRRAVEEFQDNLYDRGGVIGQCEFGLAARPENVRKVFETWASLSSSGHSE